MQLTLIPQFTVEVTVHSSEEMNGKQFLHLFDAVNFLLLTDGKIQLINKIVCMY